VSPDAEMELIGEYDEIEIPPVKPYVVRHRRFDCRRAHCGAEIKAPTPTVAATTPLGPRIHALAIYLNCSQAHSHERVRFLFRDAPLRFKLWFGKAFHLAADIANFAASTIASKKRALE
jgi:hypothetical protein